MVLRREGRVMVESSGGGGDWVDGLEYREEALGDINPELDEEEGGGRPPEEKSRSESSSSCFICCCCFSAASCSFLTLSRSLLKYPLSISIVLRTFVILTTTDLQDSSYFSWFTALCELSLSSDVGGRDITTPTEKISAFRKYLPEVSLIVVGLEISLYFRWWRGWL